MMNFGDYQSKTSTLSYNYYSSAWNDNICSTSDVAGSHQYLNDSVSYRGEEVGKYNIETNQIFSKSPRSFEHVDRTSSPYVTSLGHFQNQNVQTTKDCNQFEDTAHFRLQQNYTRNSIQLSEQISLSKYSKPSHNTCLPNTCNNYCNEFAKFGLQDPDYVVPLCFDAQSSSENDFNSAQRVGMQSCSYEENLSNVHSLLYEHNKSCASGMNSELELDQSYNTNTFSPVYNNSVKMQHNIQSNSMAKKTIPFGVDKSNFNVYPHLQMDKSENENMASILYDPYNHHWYGLGMGRMKMECWEMIVFCRNHSIYVNTGLMAGSIGLSTLLVRRLMGSKATSERMTQLEVSILKYIKCLSATSHDTGLIPLAYFLNTIYAKLNDNKPNQAHIKSIIKTFIDKLHSGFLPTVSNIPYDLTSFFHSDHFNKISIQDGSENSLKQFKSVSHLVLKNKSFSLIEYNGDFYMHLGEMVSNGLFPSINLVRRKIRKMHIQTKWLDSVESKYLNLSQAQELIKFSDLRILCGLILYLHPNMQTDLLQMFSVMDLSDHIYSTNLGPVKYTQNCFPIENTARKELQYQTIRPHSHSSTANNQKQFIRIDSLQTSPTMILGHPQIEVTSAPCMKNLQSVDPSVQMEKLGQNYDPDNEIRNENHCTIMEKNVPVPERETYVLPEERIVPPTNFLSEEPIFMDSVMNSKAKMDILDVAFKELLDGAVDICPTSDIASSQILHRSDGSTKSDNCMTPETQHDDQDVCDLACNKQDDIFDCYPTSISVLSENVQLEKGNDKLTNYVNPNCNYVEQSLKNKPICQIPEVFKKTSTYNNSIFDKENQMEHSQFDDSTVNTMVANLFPVSSNNVSSPCTTKLSKPEIFAGSGINAYTDNRLCKKQTDPQKCSQFPNTSKSLDGSNIDQYNAFKSKYSTFDKNQSKQLLANQSITIHSNVLPPPATINANKSEISTSSIVSNSHQVCNDQIRIPFMNTAPLGNEDKLLYTLPQITLPTLNSEQKGAKSFQEPEKDTFFAQKNYSLTMPFRKSPYFSSKYSQSKISTDQDSTLQDNILPSITPCEIEHVPPYDSDSTNSSLLSLSDGQLPTSNTSFQSLQINDFSSQPMLGSFEKSGNIPYKTGILSGNKSLVYNKPTTSDYVSFQVQKSCCDSDDTTTSVSESKSKSMLIFSENPEEKIPVAKNVTSAKITSCSETLLPVKNNTLLVTCKESGSSLCTDTSNCEPFKESTTSRLFSEDCSKMQKSTLATTPNVLTCMSSAFTISSPTTTFCQFTRSGPSDTLQTNQLSTNPAKNLDQFIRYKKLPESREVALNSLAFKPGITLQKPQIYKQETTCQPNVPCLESTVIQRYYKEQSFEKLLDEKPVETDDQKESRLSQVTSNIQNHTLEIVSKAAIDTLVMETNQDTFCNCLSQNVKTKDNCLTLPCFETVDTQRESLSPTLKTSDSSESGVKESKYTSTDASVRFNSAKKEVLANLNEQTSPSLIPNTAATKQHNADSLFCTNNQFHKEISDTLCLNSQNYQYSVANHKQKAKMEPDVIKSCIKVVEKEGQSVRHNSTRVKKLQCQKTLVQNEGNYTFSLGYKPMKENHMTHKSECNMKCAVLNKHEKQFSSCSEITSISMGSMKYASSSTETKAKNICEYNFCDPDILFPGLSSHTTTAKQISVPDLVNIIKLSVTGNRLHLDVAITDQARRIFENTNKDNPVQPEKTFLQQLANDCCQFAKCWFGLYTAKTLDSENMDGVSSTFIDRYIKTKTISTFQKNVCTNHGYQSNVVTRDRSIQMPPIFDSTILSCKCAKKRCGVLKIPENETSKKHKTNFKGEISKTSDLFHNVIEESPCESGQSNLVLSKKAKSHHTTYLGSSKSCEIECLEQIPQERTKFCGIECLEQIPQERTKFCEFGFRNKPMKRKIPCPENGGQLKKTKY